MSATYTAEDIAAFLQANPDFFRDHAELIATIDVPHPHGEHAISITERQLITLRDKNRLLEHKLGELLECGEDNDIKSEKMHRLSVAMVAAGTFQSVVHALEYHLSEDFAIPFIALRLWDAPANSGDLPQYAAVGEELQAFVESLTRPSCGSSAGFDTTPWFGDNAPLVRSQALVALRTVGDTMGMIALGSDDSARFQADMGTLFLERLGELVSAALARVTREPVTAATSAIAPADSTEPEPAPAD